MDIHNSAEDIVLVAVNDICDAIEKEGKESRPCTCYQCRLDTACYVLNRTNPRYVVSSRGAVRAESETLEKQQEEADVVSLIHEGLTKIAKSRRPHFDHDSSHSIAPELPAGPAFNIPTIVGRLFNGLNFEPMNDVEVTLYFGSKKAEMMDPNWQNPYILIDNTAGAFSFWPKPVPASKENQKQHFEFTLVAQIPGFEELRHYFEIPILSASQAEAAYSLERTFKLPDLYVFPPGGDEEA
ncbi:late competence development ComFB family protein [Treponema sp.]